MGKSPSAAAMQRKVAARPLESVAPFSFRMRATVEFLHVETGSSISAGTSGYARVVGGRRACTLEGTSSQD